MTAVLESKLGKGSPGPDDWVVVGPSDGTATPPTTERRGLDDGADAVDSVTSPLPTPPLSSSETTPVTNTESRQRGWSLLESNSPGSDAAEGRERGWSLLESDAGSPGPPSQHTHPRSSVNPSLARLDEGDEGAGGESRLKHRGWSLLADDVGAGKYNGDPLNVPKITPLSCLFSEDFDVPALSTSTPAQVTRQRGSRVAADIDLD
jgi:hypothetical protein